jgi:hypothetical protein
MREAQSEHFQLHDALAETERGEDRTTPAGDGPLHDLGLMRQEYEREVLVADLEAERPVERDLLAQERLVRHVRVCEERR